MKYKDLVEWAERKIARGECVVDGHVVTPEEIQAEAGLLVTAGLRALREDA